MSSLPYIGPLRPAYQRLNKFRQPLRQHLAWVSVLACLVSAAWSLWGKWAIPGVPAAGVALGLVSVVLIANVFLLVADRMWPPVHEVGLRGLALMDDWLRANEDLVAPVAMWLDGCGDLDSRHFMCLRRHVEGAKAKPLGPATAQWAIYMSNRQDLCSTAYDLAEGKVREQLLWMRKQSSRDSLDRATQVVKTDGCPRRL